MSSYCQRHRLGEYLPADDDGQCPICLVEIHLQDVFASTPQVPRYRYWARRRTKGKSRRTFEYTTEKACDFGGVGKERYWAMERRWTAKGGVVVRKAGFATRKAAKARAYKWFQQATGGSP